MYRKFLTVTVLAMGVASLTACGSSTADKIADQASSAPATAASSAPTKAPSSTEAPETTEPPAESRDTSKVGGDWITYESGLAVKVTKVKRYHPSDYAIGVKSGEVALAVTVSIKNGTSVPFDAALASVKLGYGPDGTAAEDVYDSTHSGFEGSIAKGKTKTATVAFAVPAKFKGAVSIEVEPDWDSATAFFTGGVK